MAIDPALSLVTGSRMRDILSMLAQAGTCDSDRIFHSLIHAASEALGTDYAFIGELIPGMPDHVRMLEFLADGEATTGFIYSLDTTPCRNVVNQQFRYYPKDLQSRFSDPHIRQLHANSYAAIPLYDSKKHAIGLMGVMSRDTIPDENLTRAVLSILSVRAAAELERRDALEARRHSEASYRAILESAEDAAFVHDIDTGAILDVNSRTCEIYGYSREELLEIDIGKLSSGIPPYTLESAVGLIERAKAGETVRSEWHRRNKDGSLHWDEIVIRKTVLSGHPRILIFTRDITERKHAEQALRASEEQYRAIFNASVDGMALWSPNGRLVDVNPAFAAMLGYDPSEILAGDPRQWVHPDSYPVFDQLIIGLRSGELAAELSGGKVKRIEAKNITRDGRVLVLDIYLVGFDYQGQPHVLAMKRDITERKQAEQALRASEEQYRAIFNASVDGMALWSADGQLVDVNPAFARMHGLSRKEMLAMDPHDFIHADSLHHFKRFLENLHSRQPFTAEAKGRRKAGGVFEAEVSGVPIDYQGMPHMLSISRDITERRAAEQERLRLEAQLRQTQKMEAIGHLTGGIAHDFNNILTGVMGYIGMAQERLERVPDEALIRYMDRARHAVERARDLILKMLTFSRGQGGAPKIARLTPLVENAVRLLESTIPSSIEIHTELATDLPPVSIDPVHLEQILMNLCINARDAMHNQGLLHIGVSQMDYSSRLCSSCLAEATGAYAALTVRDTGSGIEEKNLGRLFEPFFTTKEVGKGSGMGLAVVHGIVHEHGGHILVDSKPGNGTTITTLFPLLDKSTSSEPSGAQKGLCNAVSTLSGRVLLVDDDALVREYMQERLCQWGLQVNACDNGAQALALFEQAPDSYHAAILDQTMPRMTGMELAQRLYLMRPDLPVLLYTGYVDAQLDEQARSLGVHALLNKPVDNQLLLDNLRDVLL